MAAGHAHPDAMAPSVPGPTRTAPPMRAPGNSRTRVYTVFGLTGFVYLAVSISALEIVWALGGGAESWAAMQGWLASPIVTVRVSTRSSPLSRDSRARSFPPSTASSAW